jgi:cytochrome c-type biogenesis protein CcmH
MRRREFMQGLTIAGLGAMLAPAAGAQQGTPGTSAAPGAGPAQGTTSNLFDMDQEAAKTVRRPPKPGAHASMTPEQRDALEREIRCQCGCTLDVYICRTTDFSCQVSPAMHRDIISLVEGGYSAQEILDAFVATYGERALMSPKREGFNWAGYLVPFATLAAGSAALVVLLRRMQRRSAAVAAAEAPAPGARSAGVAPTDDELARLQAAVRRDE